MAKPIMPKNLVAAALREALPGKTNYDLIELKVSSIRTMLENIASQSSGCCWPPCGRWPRNWGPITRGCCTWIRMDGYRNFPPRLVFTENPDFVDHTVANLKNQ